MEYELAIVLFPDQAFTEWAESNRRGLARNFPVHLTVKRRFAVDQSIPTDKLAEDFSFLSKTTKFATILHGPVYLGGRLKWLEISPTTLGYSTVLDIHRGILELVTKKRYAGRIEKHAEYERSEFRPHITLDWTDAGIVVPNQSQIKEKITAAVTFESWGILQYSKDSLRRNVRLVHRNEFA